jgi:hypothetical protein
MRVKIQEDVCTDRYKVWILDDSLSLTPRNGVVVYPDSTYNPKCMTYAYNEILPGPSLILTRDMLQALAEEAVKTIPPNESMANHLKDAIAIRDRLLTMAEKRT